METPRIPLQNRKRLTQTRFLQQLLSDRRSKHIQAQTDRTVEGLGVHCRQWCFLAHDGGSGKENHSTNPKLPEVQTANGIVRSTKEAGVYIQELRTHLYVKLVEDSPSVLSERKARIACCIDNFVPLVGVTQQKASPSIRHDPARLTLVPDTRGRHTVQQLQEPLSDGLIDDDAALFRKTPPAEKDTWGAYCENRTPFDCNRSRMETFTQKTKRPAYLGQREPMIPNQSEIAMGFAHSPKDPKCEVCRTTKTARHMQTQTRRWNPTSFHTR